MKPIASIYDLQWEPRILIEASAGTGKTYTLTALYVRLLIEKNLTVDQILVMTFTKKATAELKERIFRRLKECLNRLISGAESRDEFANELFRKVSDKEDVVEQLQKAIRNFDDSQVYTIHGFCQKILKEEALLAGTPFDFEVVQQDELLAQASEDFWRNFMDRYSKSDAGRYYISKLMSIASTPAELRDKLMPMFSKPYARLEGEGMENPVDYLEDVLSLRHELVQCWFEDEQKLLEILHNCDVSRFQQHLESRLRKLKAFINDQAFELDKPESLKFLTSKYLYDTDNLPKNGNPEPTKKHRFFELLSDYEEQIAAIEKVKTSVIQEAFEEIKKIRLKLTLNSSAVTYDDLLKRVEEALLQSDHSGELSGTLLKKYPAALVDEFQDTDPIQYSILNSIYPTRQSDSTLLMIGDPKQAIYGFRGADIFTYIKARDEESVARYTLQKNYRSAPGFNQAVNVLFGYSDQPFIQNEIEYHEVESGNDDLQHEFRVDGSSRCGIEIISSPGIETQKEKSGKFVFSQVVQQVTELLRKAEKGEATIKERKLKAGDIAILVSSHRDAETMKQLLKRAGVGSVTYSREKVFESEEARRLNDVMHAVLEPYNRVAVNNALLSGLWGQNLNHIHELVKEGEPRQKLIDELQVLNEVWSREGFYPMFRKLMFRVGGIEELSKYSNSERMLMNLQQLADISTRAEKEGKLDPRSLHSWFQKEMADPDKDEEKTLLLESDQNLVKISTIHNSKGLEFPVVVCPTLWDVRSGNSKSLLTEYHDENKNAVIRYDQSSGEKSALAELKNKIEETAEEIRKYYVAITRARYLCIIPWSNHKDSVRSGLASSVIDSQLVKKNVEKNSKLSTGSEFSDQEILEIFRELEKRSGGVVRVNVIQEDLEAGVGIGPKISVSPEIHLRTYNGRSELKVKRRMESFSSLSGHQSDPSEPEHDQVMESYVSALHQPETASAKRTIFNFPRGATAGTAIHKLFEDRGFDFDSAASKDYSGIIEKVLEQYRIDKGWIGVIQKMISDVVLAAIPGLELSKVGRGDQLREMEFHFASGQISLQHILDIIRQDSSAADKSGDGSQFMTGFIDLIVRQNGKYHIVDYKSNHLGESIADYRHEHLEDEIKSAFYDVQYHLYTVALCLFLKSRNPDFSYDDFGGVAYLFVRGMRRGEKSGIWFHKPDETVIRDLAQALGFEL